MTWGERLRKTIAWAADNGVRADKVPKETAEWRLGICRECDSYIKFTAQCGECGCFLQVKARLEFDPVESAKQLKEVRAACPLHKW